MLHYEIARCDTGSCPYMVELVPGEFTIGDTNSPEFTTRSSRDVSQWLKAIAAGEVVAQPPLAPHDSEQFALDATGATLNIPRTTYDTFVQGIQQGNFSGFILPKSPVA